MSVQDAEVIEVQSETLQSEVYVLTAEEEAQREGVSVRTIYNRRAKARKAQGKRRAVTEDFTLQSQTQVNDASLNPLIEALNARIEDLQGEVHFLRSQVSTLLALPARTTEPQQPETPDISVVKRPWLPWILAAIVAAASLGMGAWALWWK